MNGLQPTAEFSRCSRALPWWRFSLAELMFCMTVAALDFTCWAFEPAIGCIVAALCIPATFRTLAANRVPEQSGIVPSLWIQALEFFYSVFVVITGFILFGIIACLFTMFAVIVCQIAVFLVPSLMTPSAVSVLVGAYSISFLLLFVFVQFRFLKMHWPKQGIRNQHGRTFANS